MVAGDFAYASGKRPSAISSRLIGEPVIL